MHRKTVTLVALVLMASITVGAYYSRHSTHIPAPVTASVTRGDIVSVVASTGTLSAVTTVQVGSEITGIVESLGADFNDIVHKGQILAKLDQSIYKTTLEQARAALASAKADAERYRVTQAAAETAFISCPRAARSATHDRRGFPDSGDRQPVGRGASGQR